MLDPSALAQLSALDPTGKGQIVLRILRTYGTSLDKLMAEFAEARAAGDRERLRHVAHTLRSSSASVGALALSDRCAQVEGMVRDARFDGFDAALEAMAIEGVRAAAATRAELAEREQRV